MNDQTAPPKASHPARRRPPARIEPLSVLPVFMKLRGRRVVVTGGDAPSAWKAELASAAGAAVTVYAEEMGEALEALASRPARDGFGPVELVRRRWSVDDLSDAALLIGDAATEDEARALKRAGEAAGLPVNVIDRPAWCDFQFSTIVNRSPLVIAISTDGAAPIVGQAVRQRIEAVLGPALGAWAKLAERIRPLVNETLTLGPERRAFWRGFAARVFGPAPAGDAEADLAAAIDAIRVAKPGGKIVLVGTGPLSSGETAGLTLGAVAALQSADRVLYATAVPDAVLELARREAEREALDLANPAEASSVIDVAERWAAEGEIVALVLPGDPASQWRELAGALGRQAEATGVELEAPPAVADAFLGTGQPYLDRIQAAGKGEPMVGNDAIPVFTDALQYRVVGDEGLLVLIGGEEAFNARGIPRSFLLKVDGQTPMGAIVAAVDKELAEPIETIRRSVDELIGRLEAEKAIRFR